MPEIVPMKDKIKQVSDLLSSTAMQRQLARALPRHVTPERLARLALTQIQRVPKLLECDRESFLGAIMESAQLGLEPGVAGQCWILPFKGKATFIAGYRGLAQLAWRSSLVSGLAARAVFEGDHFDYDFGMDRIEHKPGGESDPKKLTHAYSILHTSTGGRLWDVMTREEIEKVRARSPAVAAKRSTPWDTDYAEMAKKTVFKRMMKLAPCSVEIMRAMDLDDDAERGVQDLHFDLPERDVTPPKEEPERDPNTGEEIPEGVGREPEQGNLA